MSSREAAKAQIERSRFEKAAKLYIKAAEEHKEAQKPDLALEDYENAIVSEEKSDKQKKLYDYLGNAFSFAQTHDTDRAAKWAEKLIPMVKGKIDDLDVNKKQKDLAENYKYLALLYSAVNDLEKRKSALENAGDYQSTVAIKTLDTKKESKLIEGMRAFDAAVSIYLDAERPEKALNLRFKEVGLNLAYQRLSAAQDVIGKIQGMLEEFPPDIKPMGLHEAFQKLSEVYVKEGSILLSEKKKEEIIQIGTNCFETARELSSQGQASEEIPAIWVQQGNVHLKMMRYKDALSAYSKASKIAKEVNNANALKLAITQLIRQGFNESIKIVDKRRLIQEQIIYPANPGALLFDKAREIMKEMDLYSIQGPDLADHLIKIGKSIVEKHQDFNIAFEYFQRPSEVLIEIEEKNNGTELATYLAGLDAQLIKQKNIQQSNSYSELISKILDSFNQRNEKAELIIKRAEALLSVARYSDAHLALVDASEIFLQIDNISSAEAAAQTLFEQGLKLIESRNQELGFLLSKDADSINEKTDNAKRRADNFRLRAESYLKIKMNLEAFNDFKAAIEIYRSINDNDIAITVAQRVSEVGISLLQQKEREIGQEFCEFALEISKDLERYDLASEIIFQKATRYREIGDLEKALQDYKRAGESFIALNNTERAINVADELLQMAFSLIATKTLEIGQQYVESGIKIFKTLKERKKEGLALSRIGKAFHEIGKIETAIEFFDDSISALEKAKEENLLAETYSAKGKSLREKALSLVSSDAEAVKEISKEIQNIYEKAASPEKGIETVSELSLRLLQVEKYKLGVELSYAVADSYLKLKKKETAGEALAKAAELIVTKNQVDEGVRLYKRSINLLAEERKHDRVEQLVKDVEEIARSMISSNEMDKGRQVLESLETTCEKQKLRKILGELRLRESKLFLGRDEIDLAEDLMDRAIAAFEEIDEEQMMAISSTYVDISRELAKKSDTEGCRKSFEKLIGFLTSKNQQQKAIETCQAFARELVELGSLVEANEIIRIAGKLLKEEEKEGLKASAMMAEFAKNMVNKDQIDLAISLFSEASDFLEKGQPEGLKNLASDFLQVSFQFRAKGRNELAMKFLGQAENAYAKADALEELGESFCERTKGALANEALDDAFWFAEFAATTLRKIGTTKAEIPINILTSTGRSLVGTKNELASRIFTKASKLLVEVDGNAERAVELLSREARNFYDTGDKFTGSQVVADASQMLAEVNETISAARVHSTFGSFLAENNDFHDALREFNKGVEILAGAGDEGKEEMAAIGASLFRLAREILASGESVLGNKVADQAKQTTTRFQLPQTEELIKAQQAYMDAQLDAMSFTIRKKPTKKKKRKKK